MKMTKAVLWATLTLLLAFAPVKYATAQTCVQPPSGLVSWWPGDGDASDIQDGNNGTLVNGATFAPGKVGQAFNLDGVDDVVDIANEANFDFDRTDSFTIDAWIKSTPKVSGNQFVISKSGLADGYRGYFIALIDEGFSVGGTGTFFVGGGQVCLFFLFTDTKFTAVCGTKDVIDGNWHHIAAVNDGAFGGTPAGMKIYVDGVQGITISPQDTLGANSVLNNFTVRIGGRHPAPDPAPVEFNGEIDEVEIYNRALTASEIQAIFYAGRAGKCRPVTGFDLDHFECYKAWTAKGTPRFEPLEVTLDGQPGSKTVTVLKPVSICIPVDKKGEGIINPYAYLVCYRFKIKDAEEGAEPIKSDVLVQNQFGEQTLTVLRPHFLRYRFLRSYFLRHQTLCVPSTREDLGIVGDDDD